MGQIEREIKLLNIEKNNIIAFGDSMNDVPMFEKSGYKIAMKNAKQELKNIYHIFFSASSNIFGYFNNTGMLADF